MIFLVCTLAEDAGWHRKFGLGFGVGKEWEASPPEDDYAAHSSISPQALSEWGEDSAAAPSPLVVPPPGTTEQEDAPREYWRDLFSHDDEPQHQGSSATSPQSRNASRLRDAAMTLVGAPEHFHINAAHDPLEWAHRVTMPYQMRVDQRQYRRCESNPGLSTSIGLTRVRVSAATGAATTSPCETTRTCGGVGATAKIGCARRPVPRPRVLVARRPRTRVARARTRTCAALSTRPHLTDAPLARAHDAAGRPTTSSRAVGTTSRAKAPSWAPARGAAPSRCPTSRGPR